MWARQKQTYSENILKRPTAFAGSRNEFYYRSCKHLKGRIAWLYVHKLVSDVGNTFSVRHSGPTCSRVKGCEEPSSSKFLLWVTFFNVINDDVFSGDVATKKKRASNVNAICSWNISSTSAQYISGFLEIYQAFLVSISRFLEIY